MIQLTTIKARDSKRGGQVFEGPTAPTCSAEIVPGASIRLFGLDRSARKLPFSVTFKVGDAAEYDSYNLSYYGTITSITDKTVTIVKSGAAHRLSIYDFTWRNRDFDLAKTKASNTEELRHL